MSEKKTIKEWQTELAEVARTNGFFEEDLDPRDIAVALCLIHSEVSEGLEEVRNKSPNFYYNPEIIGKPEGLASELADVVIRSMHLCELLDIDLEDIINKKNEYNKTRTHKHGGKAF